MEAALAGDPAPAAADVARRKEVVRRHIELQARYDRQPLGPLRRIISWYFRECHGAAEFRDTIHHAQSVEEMRALVDAFPA